MTRFALLLMLLVLGACGGGGGGGSAQAQEPGAMVLVLRNDTGQVVGRIMDSDYNVVLTISNALTQIRLQGGTVLQELPLFFSGASCTGTAYAQVRPPVMNRLASRNNGIWYVAARNGAEVMVSVSSSGTIENGCANFTPAVLTLYVPIALTAGQSSTLTATLTGPFEAALVPESSLTGI